MSFRVEQGKSVLEGHIRKKKRIVSPFSGLPLTQTNFTADIFPELLWLALILERYGYRQGIEIAAPFQAALHEMDGSKSWHRTSEIASINAELWKSLREPYRPFKIQVEEALLPIACIYPELSMMFIDISDCDRVEMVERLTQCVGRFSNRFETPGCALIGGFIFLQAFIGRMRLPREMIERITLIVDKPGSEEAELASSMVRAAILAIWSADASHSNDWPKMFWRANRLVSACDVGRSNDG